MRLLISLNFLLALSYADHYTVEVHDDITTPGLEIGPKGKVIAEKIEALRDDLKKKYDGSFNNEKISFNLEKQHIQADITVTGKIEELFNFNVTVESKLWPLYPATYTYKLVWENIDINISAYDLKGYVQQTKVYGKGKLKLNIKNLVVKGIFAAKIKFSQQKLLVDISKLTTDITMGEGFNFKITGWLNDKIRSQIVTAIVTKSIPEIMKDYKPQIDEMVGDTLFNLVKDTTIPL